MLNVLWILLLLYLIILSYKNDYKCRFKNKINISSIYLSLGTKMGIGSLISIIYLVNSGGILSIIIMQLITIITSKIIKKEVYYSNKYKSNSLSGSYFYTLKGLNKKYLALIILALFLITYTCLFMMIQTNAISYILSLNKIIISIIISIILFLLINNNTKQLISLLNLIMPIISIIIIIVFLSIIIKNIQIIPIIIKNNLLESLNIKSLLHCIVLGVSKGIYINELLIGTTSFISGSNNNSSPLNYVLSNYFISFVISSLMGIVVLIYNYYTNTKSSLFTLLPYFYKNKGIYITFLIIIILCLTAIISGIFIAKKYIYYFIKNKKSATIIEFLLTLIILSGIFIKIDNIIKIIDIFLLMLVLLNTYILNKLINKDSKI